MKTKNQSVVARRHAAWAKALQAIRRLTPEDQERVVRSIAMLYGIIPWPA